LQGARLIYATAQPLTFVRTPGYLHYFYFAPDGIQPEFCFDTRSLQSVHGDVVETESADGRMFVRPKIGRQFSFTLLTGDNARVIVTTLTRTEAEHTWKGVAWGTDRVVHCEADVVFDSGALAVSALDKPEVNLTVFPNVESPLRAKNARLIAEPCALCTNVQLGIPAQTVPLQIEECGGGKYMVYLPALSGRSVSEVFLEIDYEGDTGMAFLDGTLVADNFCNGLPWVIGLRRFEPSLSDKGMCLVFRPVRQGTIRNVSSNLAADYEFEGTERLIVRSITARPQYSTRVTSPE
jgi:hypothetical protein